MREPRATFISYQVLRLYCCSGQDHLGARADYPWVCRLASRPRHSVMTCSLPFNTTMGTFTLPSAVLYHHDFDLRVRKANLPRALFSCCCAVTSAVLLILLYLCAAVLQPSCPGNTHRVAIAIWHPRRSIYCTNCAHLAR